MAHHSHTLQFADDSNRYLFGLTLGQTVAVVALYLLVKDRFPTLLHGLGALAAALGLWGLCRLTAGVRREPYVAQLAGYLVRRLLGPSRAGRPRPHVILEVDGYTRHALTEDEQDIRLIDRLQRIVAAACPTGALQLIVTNQAREAGALVTEERQQQHPIGRVMGQLADRKIARLAARGLKETDLRYYLVLYEPTGWERTLWGRLPFAAFWGTRDDDVALLDDLVAETRTQLAAMGLAARRVERIAGGLDPDARGETATTVRLADGRYAASVYMLLPPAETDPGWLDAVLAQPGPYVISLWAHGTDPNRERLRLASRNRQTGLQLVTAAAGIGVVGGSSAGEKSAQFREAEAAMLRLRQPGQGLLKTGLYLCWLGETPLEARRRARRAMLVLKGPAAATPATGLGHQWPLAASTGPGRDWARACWRLDAETIANAYPFNRANPSTRAGLLLGETERGELVRLDPADESLRNALCVVFGISGMGKTFLALKLIKEWLLRGGRVTVLDRTGHYAGLGALCDARTVSSADELRAVPLHTQMVVVDLRGNRFGEDFRAAVDARVQTPVGALQHLFVLEEAWQLEYLDASFWVMDLAKRGRHWGGFVLWITHDPEELLDHKQLTQMFNQAAVKIAFALVDTRGVASRLGSALGLTPTEIALVKALHRGQCYVMRHNMLEGSVVRGAITVAADPDEEWLFATDPRTWQYRARAAEIARRGGDVWAAVKHLADNTAAADGEVISMDALEEAR